MEITLWSIPIYIQTQGSKSLDSATMALKEEAPNIPKAPSNTQNETKLHNFDF